jgi:hypothetical protein
MVLVFCFFKKIGRGAHPSTSYLNPNPTDTRTHHALTTSCIPAKPVPVSFRLALLATPLPRVISSIPLFPVL